MPLLWSFSSLSYPSCFRDGLWPMLTSFVDSLAQYNMTRKAFFRNNSSLLSSLNGKVNLINNIKLYIFTQTQNWCVAINTRRLIRRKPTFKTHCILSFWQACWHMTSLFLNVPKELHYYCKERHLWPLKFTDNWVKLTK